MISTYGPDRMSALFPVLQRTLNIDQALLEVYGMDQYGLDSAWRVSLGLDPLPSPEDLESQLSEQAEDSQAEDSKGDAGGDAGGDAEGDTEPTVEPTSIPEPTPDTEPLPAGATGEGDEESKGGSASPGCNAPTAGGSANVPIGVGMLLLLGAPLGLVALPRLRRRWPFP